MFFLQVGHKPEPTKHFTLKKKQKSAILRADLLQKSSDAASNLKKSSAPVIPVRSRGMPRKMTDTSKKFSYINETHKNLYFVAPLKGIPSRVPTSGFRSGVLNNNINNRPPLARLTAGRKEGGVKLLDIADQPLGYAAAKKRKKMQEIEDAKKNTENTSLQSPPPVTSTTTPDYAAGLSSTPAYAPPTPQPILTTSIISTYFFCVVIIIVLFLATSSTTVTTPVATTVTTTQATVKLATVPATQFTPAPSMRPVPPLLATTPAGQRTILTDQVKTIGQVSNIAIAQRTTQATPTVTHIRIQPQTTSNALQRRGLALTVSYQVLEELGYFEFVERANVGSSGYVPYCEQSDTTRESVDFGIYGRIKG